MRSFDEFNFTSTAASPVSGPKPSADYENSTYVVVSKIAYLAGVQKSIFEKECEPPKMEWYETLHKDKNARIVRNLCMLRTAIERNYKNIFNEIRFNGCSLLSLPQYVPQTCLNELEMDGISIVKSNATLNQYIIDINGHISNRINNCKHLFPIWLKWDYIKELFIMPNGVNYSAIE